MRINSSYRFLFGPLWHFYYKMRQLFFYKMLHMNLLQNAPGFLLQNATVITKCDNIATTMFMKIVSMLLSFTLNKSTGRSLLWQLFATRTWRLLNVLCGISLCLGSRENQKERSFPGSFLGSNYIFKVSHNNTRLTNFSLVLHSI